MAFRADEDSERGRERAFRYLVPERLSPEQRKEGGEKLEELIAKYGPVVDAYPYWHPLVATSKNKRRPHTYPVVRPHSDVGYECLDHTVFLRNAFITCPYSGAERLVESVHDLDGSHVATLSAEILEVPLYMPNATPVLVTCDWDEVGVTPDGTIPKSVAVPLFLKQELKTWKWAKVAEPWETMRDYILGEPCGSRSSLFVNQETGQTLKTLYNTLIQTGMYGPIFEG